MTVTHPRGVDMKNMQAQARAWLATQTHESAPAAVEMATEDDPDPEWDNPYEAAVDGGASHE